MPGFGGFCRVLGGFAGFWGVLGGFAFAFVFWAVGSGGVLGGGFCFCFCFCNLIFGSGGGLVFGWAGLCWAGRFFFLLWNLILASWGRLAGFAFCFCRSGWAGLGWAAAGLGWAGLSSRTF